MSDNRNIGFDATMDSGTVELYCPHCDTSFGTAGGGFCPNDGTTLIRLVQEQDKLAGTVLSGRFLVGDKLGQGGMGAVYRARQQTTGRDVAVKVIDPRLSGNREATKRFLRECKLTTKLSHPGSVTVLDFGQDPDGRLFLVMELIKGQTLGDALMRAGEFDLEKTMRIAAELCEVLEAAHKQEIIHRDLKPSNIILREDSERVVVLDFGLAKSLAGDDSLSTVTRSEMVVGTPSYMAPEIAQGMRADRRADLYALGVIIYEMLTGVLPFRAETVRTMIAMHVTEAPVIPDSVPRPIARVIERLLAKSPDARPASAAEARLELLAAFREGMRERGVDSPLALSDTIPPGQAVSASAARTVPRGEAPVAPASLVAPASAALDPALQATAAVHLAPRPRSRRGWWLAAAGALVVAVGGVSIGLALSERGVDPARQPAPPPTEPTPAATPPATAAPPPATAGAAADAAPAAAIDAAAAPAPVPAAIDAGPTEPAPRERKPERRRRRRDDGETQRQRDPSPPDRKSGSGEDFIDPRPRPR